MWTYNNIRITVVDMKEQDEGIIAKLQPIDAGTVYHTFGYINKTIALQGLVVGKADIDLLEDIKINGSAHSLVYSGSFYENFGNFYLDKLSTQWMTSYRQTFRPDKDPQELVFRVVLELSKT